MTSAEILRKAIAKAIQNGWYIGNYKVVNANPVEGTYCVDVWFSDDTTIEIAKHDVIYRHDFAKAFFGEDSPNSDDCLFDKKGHGKFCGKHHHGNYWKYNLQCMVIEENPFKYLEKFL